MDTQICKKCNEEKTIDKFNRTIDGKVTLFCSKCIDKIRNTMKIDDPFNQATCST